MGGFCGAQSGLASSTGRHQARAALQPGCELVAPDSDIIAQYDVEVPMADGFALTANVFRSRRHMSEGQPSPVVMCAHPYDNHLIPALNTTPLEPAVAISIVGAVGGNSVLFNACQLGVA